MCSSAVRQPTTRLARCWRPSCTWWIWQVHFEARAPFLVADSPGAPKGTRCHAFQVTLRFVEQGLPEQGLPGECFINQIVCCWQPMLPWLIGRKPPPGSFQGFLGSMYCMQESTLQDHMYNDVRGCAQAANAATEVALWDSSWLRQHPSTAASFICVRYARAC